MKKLSEKRRRWLISHSEKALIYITKHKKVARKNKPSHVKGSKPGHKDKRRRMLHAPACLSLTQNREETLQFFEFVHQTIKRCIIRNRLYFDLSGVEYISTDAIMYLIALIKNVKLIKALEIECYGNMPRNKEACELIETSGFYNFVSALNHSTVSAVNDRIQISSGCDADGTLTAKICDFVHGVSGTSVRETKRLYSMIMELMTNTKQHAYLGESGVMADKWYIFAEDMHECVRFVFLDTGLGIPTTINKKFTEKVKEMGKIIGIETKDSKYISSALRGEFRTETKQHNRGKGLPGILEDSCDGLIKGLKIISGYGECECGIMPDCEIREDQLGTNFLGTLFIWDFTGGKELYNGINNKYSE